MFISRFRAPSRRVVAIVVLCGVVFCAEINSARATFLTGPPTGPFAPSHGVPITVSPSTLSPSGNIVAETSSSLTNGFQGSVTEVVVADTNNVYASLDYTFIYQVTLTNPSNGLIEHLTGFDYTGYATNVGDANLVIAGTTVGSAFSTTGGTNLAAPDSVNTVTGSVISFNFPSFTSPPDTTSYLLIVQTNAPSQTSLLSTINVIDGTTSTVQGIQPFGQPTSTMTPEPSSVVVVGIGLGLVGFGWLRRRNAQEIAPVAA